MSGRRAASRPGGAVTVGSFDGLHLGHQAVLRALLRCARERELETVVVTFEPHPQEVLRDRGGPLLLTERAEKSALLASFGVERLHVLAFTPAFARLEAEDFVRHVLVERLGCRALVVGEDHRFGHGRGGGPGELRRLAAAFDIHLDVVPAVRIRAEPVSSTRTRRAVAAAELELAAELLGRPYGVFAPVVRGAGRGRTLGVPTVNLAVSPVKQMPPEGIYACRAAVGGWTGAAAVHWGGRPTFGETAPVLEAHLLRWSGELYGAWVEIGFLQRLRDVAHFDRGEELARAMEEDVRRTAEIADGWGALREEPNTINCNVLPG